MEFLGRLVRCLIELAALGWVLITNSLHFLVLCTKSRATLAAENIFLPKAARVLSRERKVVPRRFDNGADYQDSPNKTRRALARTGVKRAAIAAATVRRYLAHITQHLANVDISTRKVAMCAYHVMGAMVAALLDGRLSRIRKVINNAVAFLANNARRAHPQRDRRTGRLELHLEPVFNQGLST